MTSREPTTLLRAAVRPRMLVLLLVLLTAATACGLLGAWQLGRAELRGAQAARLTLAEKLAAEPVRLADVLAPQESFRAELVGRRVSVAGTYEADGQLLVAGRFHDGVQGFLVLTPLRVDGAASSDGAAARPVLAVVRGWVADAASAELFAVPQGEVAVEGYLQAGEAAGPGGVPTGQTEAISVGSLVNDWGGPIFTGYLALTTSDPPQPPGLTTVDPPTPSGGAGLNIQNLAYALQWWIFGAFAVLLWLRLLRDEASGYPTTAARPVNS